jgi:cytochrome c556
MHGVYARAFYTSARCILAAAAAAALGSCSAADPQATYQPVATVDQIMEAIVIPSSEALFDAVVYDTGVLVAAPKADDDWYRLQMQAFAVAEAGNLLLMPPRAKDRGDWQTFARALTDAAAKVAKAAESKDVDRLLATGSEMYAACTSCHRKYLPMD